MGNTTDSQEGGEAQDEIPRDTQINNQYIESPSAHSNQVNQQNQIQTGQQQQILIQGGEQINNINQLNQAGMQYQVQQGSQMIQQQFNQGRVQYQINQANQEYEEQQNEQENAEYQENQGYEEQGYEEGQEYEEMEGNQEYEANQEIQDNNENIEGQEGQENDEVIEGEFEEVGDGEGEGEAEGEIEGEAGGEIEAEGEKQIVQEGVVNKNDQEGNNQINQQRRQYQINKDGKTYQVNEEIKQYQMNSGDNRYQMKKEIKTTKIESQNENSPNFPNNRQSQKETKISSTSREIKNTGKVLPKDSLPKVYIQSGGYYDNPQGRYPQYYSDIPRYMSFQRSTLKNSAKIHSSVNVVKTENTSELIEIPRSEYDSYAGRETIFIGGGMDTGEYKFRGQGIVITQAEIPDGKIIINEEEIIKEINRRKNKPKKEKRRRYEVLDKFYAITEFDGKPIKKIEKVERQQKQYEYEEQQKYFSTSKGNAGYQFSSKESQSQQIQSNNQTQSQYSQQFQFHQSQYQQPQNLQQPQLQQSQQSQEFQQSQKFHQSQQFQQSQNQSLQQSQQSQQFQQSQLQQSERSQQFQQSQQSQSKIQQMTQNNMNINNSNFKFKNLPLTLAPSDNYSKYLLEQINKLRVDPQSYIGIIEDAKNNIIKDKYGRLIYNGKMKIALTDGEVAFNNAINYLKNVKSMQKLIFNPYLMVELPKSENEINYKNDLRLKVENMVNNGIHIKSYWRDIIKDPEISFLMMIVDDNGDKSGMRRRDLLDPNMKYIGINSIEINGHFVCYITLSTAE